MNGILALCHFCEQHGPTLVFTTQALRNTSSFDDLSVDVKKSTDAVSEGPSSSCEACGWTADSPCFITHDEESNSTLVSQHQPRRTELYSVVRRACLRALSSEISPSRNGGIVFGDHEQGYTFSYTFALHDGKARGGLRRYSLLMVMSDVMHLVSSWLFLDQHLQVLAQELSGRVRTTEG